MSDWGDDDGEGNAGKKKKWWPGKYDNVKSAGPKRLTPSEALRQEVAQLRATRADIQESFYSNGPAAAEVAAAAVMPYNKKFLVVHFGTFAQPTLETMVPAEFCIAAFSIQQGLRRCYSRVIDPGPIPLGLGSEFRQSRAVGEYLLPPFDETFNWQEHLIQPLEEFTKKYPSNPKVGGPGFLYTMNTDLDKVNKCLRYIGETTGCEMNYKVISLSLLLEILLNQAEHLRQFFGRKPATSATIVEAQAIGILRNLNYECIAELGCNFHQLEQHQGGLPYCSMSLVKRWIYNLLPILCRYYRCPRYLETHIPDCGKPIEDSHRDEDSEAERSDDDTQTDDKSHDGYDSDHTRTTESTFYGSTVDKKAFYTSQELPDYVDYIPKPAPFGKSVTKVSSDVAMEAQGGLKIRHLIGTETDEMEYDQNFGDGSRSVEVTGTQSRSAKLTEENVNAHNTRDYDSEYLEDDVLSPTTSTMDDGNSSTASVMDDGKSCGSVNKKFINTFTTRERGDSESDIFPEPKPWRPRLTPLPGDPVEVGLPMLSSVEPVPVGLEESRTHEVKEAARFLKPTTMINSAMFWDTSNRSGTRGYVPGIGRGEALEARRLATVKFEPLSRSVARGIEYKQPKTLADYPGVEFLTLKEAKEMGLSGIREFSKDYRKYHPLPVEPKPEVQPPPIAPEVDCGRVSPVSECGSDDTDFSSASHTRGRRSIVPWGEDATEDEEDKN